MKSILKSLLVIFSLLLTNNLFAHYIWIEASPTVKLGQEQTVKIFYGEYENKLLEEAGKRMEEVAGLEAWIIDPSGKKEVLKLDKQQNHYSARLTPSLKGRYQVMVINSVRPVVDWTVYDLGVLKPTYYSSFVFQVGEKDQLSTSVRNDLELLAVHEAINFSANKEVKLNAFFKGDEIKKAKLMVYAPNGWMKELERNGNGEYSFIPFEKGQYVIETIYKERTPGVYQDKKYEAIRHRATLSIYIR
jgi:uncharacterized GH25 family protein